MLGSTKNSIHCLDNHKGLRDNPRAVRGLNGKFHLCHEVIPSSREEVAVVSNRQKATQSIKENRRICSKLEKKTLEKVLNETDITDLLNKDTH